MMTNPLIHSGMTVAVLGMGISGMAAIRYLHSHGCRVLISDSRLESQLSTEEKKVIGDCGAEYEGGGHSRQFLQKAALIFKSPGIPGELDVLQQCREAGIGVVGELALAAPVLNCKVVAITGTNGKTTVATLFGELLAEAGIKAGVCGNIGRPLLDCLREEEKMDVAVVEVSSFQLEDSGDFRPDVGVILNITPDHLDRHSSIEDYVNAKARLFANQKNNDIAILCADDTICLELANTIAEGPATHFFGHIRENSAYICESDVYVRWNSKLEKYDFTGSPLNNHIGLLNSSAAILAARHFGVEHHQIQRVLRSFQPLPHRMELVDVIGGVRYCNDSKATNTGAVISALHQAKGKVILIAGGRDKGDDYRLLRGSIQDKVKRILLIGEAAEKIAADLHGVISMEQMSSLRDAVVRASEVANYGDTVLLSPACASFDMFESYGHRGEVFRQCVRSLRKDSSEVDTGA